MTASVPVFDIRQQWIDRVLVVSVHGDLDAVTAPRLNDEIVRILPEHPAAVIVDLSTVDFLASSGITILVMAHERITPAARFGVVADGPSTSRPLKLMGIDTILALYPTVSDAITACTTT